MKTLLKVLCILTFICSGFCFVLYSMMAIPSEKFWDNAIEEAKAEESFEQMMELNPQFEAALDNGLIILQNKPYLILMALLCVCSVIGAAFMLRGKVLGFHIYTLAHLVIIVLPLLIFRSMDFSIFGMILSLAMIGLYALVMFKKPANPEVPISE